MSKQEFQKQVLDQLSQQCNKLDSIETRLSGVEKNQKRQAELNQVVIGELERLGKMRTDLTVISETGLAEQAALIREQNRMYTDTKISEHEVLFH